MKKLIGEELTGMRELSNQELGEVSGGSLIWPEQSWLQQVLNQGGIPSCRPGDSLWQCSI